MTWQPVEKKFLTWLIVAVVVLTSAPYVFGWLATPANRTYTGIHRLTPGDVAVYYSFIEQGRQGKVVSRNLYSSEAQPVPAVFTPQWFIVGQLAHLFRLPTVVAYQLTRVFFGVIFLLLLYRFLAGIFVQPRTRMIATTVATFATGFGALVPLGDLASALQHLAIPVDLWVPEAFPFLSLYHNPLFLMGLCGILGIFMLVERAYDQHDRAAAWLASGLAVVLAIIHPYDVFLIAAVLVTSFFVRILGDRTWTGERSLAYLRILTITLLPAIVVLGILRTIFFMQPGLAGWAGQNVTLSPAVWWYLPAYLLPVVLAVTGITRALRMASTRAFLTLAWAGVVPVLLYLPHFPYQRRMLEGWFIALVILSALGLVAFWQKLRVRFGPIGQTVMVSAAVTLGILLTGVTSLTHLAKDAYYASLGREPVSVPTGVIDAFRWIRDNTGEEAVALARPFEANLLPGWSGRTVFFGHSDLTAASKRKQTEVQAFFTPTVTFDRRAFLAHNHISTILVRRDDVAGVAVFQSLALSVQLTYENEDAEVYAVVRTEP